MSGTSPHMILQIGGPAVSIVLLIYGLWQAKQDEGKVEGWFQRLGIKLPVSLGLCLAGMPDVNPAAEVTCGLTATEMIFLAEAAYGREILRPPAEVDGREVLRLPLASILGVFGGDEKEVYHYLEARAALPSLILTPALDSLNPERRKDVSFLVIDWKDDTGRSQRLVFQCRGKVMGSVNARSIELQLAHKKRSRTGDEARADLRKTPS